MKYILLFFLLTACTVTKQRNAVSKNRLEKIMQVFNNPQSKQVLVTAHRADWRNAPENSIQAIQNAIALGVDMVEIDVQKTKDGVLVLCHDNTIDRTMSGKGRIEDFTLADLQKLTLKNEHGCPTEHRIATFEECMLVAKGKVMVNVDKADGKFKEVYEMLQKTGTLGQALVKSIYPYQKSLELNGDYFKYFLFMPVVHLDEPNAAAIIKDYFAALKPVAAEMVFQRDTSVLLDKYSNINKQGAKVWYNSLWASLCAGHNDDKAVEQDNKKDSWDWLLAHGVNIIQTDRPVQLLQYLKSKGLHD